MAVEVRLTPTVAVPDDGLSPVGSDEWNAAHLLNLTGPALVGRETATQGAAAEIAVGAGLSLSGGTLSATGGGAPVGASYVTLGADGTLTSERVLTAGAGVSVTDGGAGSTVTVANTDRGSTAVTSHEGAADPHPQYAELTADQTFTGEVSFGDPGTEAGSITVNGVSYDAIVKINEFGGTRDAALILHRHATATAATLGFARARGTDATHVNVQSGDVIGYLDFAAWHTSSYYRCAEVTAEIDGTPGAADMPGRLVFKVTPDGSQTPAEALRISQNRVANFAVTPTVAGSTIWHSGNDGPGSGLDADTLDGNDASAFAPAGHVGAGGAAHANVVAAGAAGFMTGADKTKLDGIASGAQVNVPTDLSYTAATRLLASSTGADATLPLVSTGDAGLAPASGGGTSNFLRADGAWAAPGGGGATNLTYTAATRVIASDTGTDATLPLVTSGDAGLAPASGGGTSNFLRADGTWAAPAGGGGAAAIKSALVSIPYGVNRASVTVVDAAIAPGMNIIATQGATVGTDENDQEMDAVLFSAVAQTGQFLLTVAAAACDRIGGAFRIAYTYGT